jgi:Zn-dependent protease
MDISADQFKKAILSLIAFIVSVSVHEFGHAWMATKLGDGTPKAQGRLTLSPVAHIDLVGTILMPLIGALIPGGFPMLAWGKPVQTNPTNYTRKLRARTGHMLVALAGPAMNLVMAVVVSVAFIGLAKAGVLSARMAVDIIRYLLVLNLVLLFFNLIPLPPLDGGAVLAGVLPDSLQVIPQTLQRYGFILFLVLLISPAMGYIMRPVYDFAGAWGAALLRYVPA